MDKKMRRVGVVDAVRVFNEYNMKIDLEAQVKTNVSQLEHKIDSIEHVYKIGRNILKPKAIDSLGAYYKIIRQELDVIYAESNQEINVTVWKRLNPLLDEYGKENDMHLIIGANGMGSVLYNDEYYDHTEDVIKFVNSRYENK